MRTLLDWTLDEKSLPSIFNINLGNDQLLNFENVVFLCMYAMSETLII